LYCALVERHGGDTRNWPSSLISAEAPGVEAAAQELADRVSFHAWVQWLIEQQLSDANAELPVMTDLAIGVDRAGADAWVWPDAFCTSVSVGAPPDTFNTQGQNWGLPPFNPWKLRDAGYEPFIATVRAAMTGAGSLRMDHVMGLFRLWWIPEDHTPKDGCYVYMPYRDLTAIVALESSRHGVPVVGEDLGTVEPYVSDELARRRILSYKLLQFESAPATDMPVDSMVAITTHDLPTVAGMWTGADLIDGLLAEVVPNDEGLASVRSALATRAALSATPATVEHLLLPLSEDDRALVTMSVPVGSIQAAAAAAGLTKAGYVARLRSIRQQLSDARMNEVPAFFTGLLSDLASSPSRIVAATLDDAIYVEERPNLPGTTDQRPNWQLGLPAPIEVIMQHPGAQSVGAILSSRKVDPTMGKPISPDKASE
jgi:4-alpha-glucanotransferase